MAAGGKESGLARGDRIALAVLVALGVALRLSQVDLYTAYWADETHQYLEQAYRLLTGTGLVPWEYVAGLRSWLLPLLLAGPMALGSAIGGAAGGIFAARAIVFVAALAMMPAAFAIGRTVSRGHALAALGAVALWFEIVTWSAHVLTETISITAFLVAAALLMTRRGARATAAAGALLAFAAIMRVQHGPALGVFAVLMLKGDWTRWRALILGAVPVVAVSSAVDLGFGQWPFEWIWQNYDHTVAGDRGAAFGEQPATWYFAAMGAHWLVALPVLLFGVVKAPAAMRPLIWAALINIAAHMMIGHKEYRYIALSLVVLVMVGAIGWVGVRRQTRARRIAVPLVVAGVSALSLGLALRGPEDLDSIQESTMPRLEALAVHDPGTCGIAAIGPGVWAVTRHVMDRQVPLYLFNGDKIAAAQGPAGTGFNRAIAAAAPGPGLAGPGYAGLAPAGYRPTGSCNGEGADRVCLYRREGGCRVSAAGAPFEIQRYRRDRGL